MEYTVTNTYTDEEGKEVIETETKTRIEYDFYKNYYTASLSVNFELIADTYCMHQLLEHIPYNFSLHLDTK